MTRTPLSRLKVKLQGRGILWLPPAPLVVIILVRSYRSNMYFTLDVSLFYI